MEETIRANVEAKLFRYYRNAGSLVFTVLGLVGVTIGWPALQTQIRTSIATQISEQVKKPVADAQVVATKAENLAKDSLRSVETGLELIREKQTRITDTLGRLDARSEDLNRTFAKVYAQIAKLNQDAQDLQERMDAYNEQFKFNLATQDDLKPINQDLISLASKSSDLAAAIQKIQKSSSGFGTGGTLVNSFKDVVAQAKKRSKTASTTKSTVYVQFAGGRREDIKIVSEKLREQGWLIPGEERTTKAVGLKEIRYFHALDTDSANRLADDTNEALSAIGFETIVVSAKDNTKYPKAPRQGVLELWITIPGR